MSRFGRLVRTAGCIALTGVGATPALAQFQYQYPAQLPASVGTDAPASFPGTARALPGSAALPTDSFNAGFHRRGAPQPYQAPPPADCCPPMTVPGTTYPGLTPGTNPGMPPGMNPGMNPGMTPQPAPQAPAPGAPDLFSGADAGPTAGLGGYIDNALPVNVFRLRYDAMYGNNRPDRGEFFYAKCGCFNTQNAHGPPNPSKNVDSQELSAYVEYAVAPRVSFFADIPVRFINPDANTNAAGFSDVHLGGKYAFLYSSTRVLTAQMQVILPNGRTPLGLGTGNVWLEPALLYQEQMSARWQVFGQLKDQFSVAPQSDFTGNILTYGLGTSYTVANGSWGYVAPVGEVVGWTLLSGKEFNPDTGMAQSARGDTIVNAKFGTRIGFGPSELGQAYPSRSDLYLGYGRALTGEVWYKDMFRVEYRLFY